MKKGGGSESTIIVGPSKCVLVYALHSLEYVLGLARFRVFVPKLYSVSHVSFPFLKTAKGLLTFDLRNKIFWVWIQKLCITAWKRCSDFCKLISIDIRIINWTCILLGVSYLFCFFTFLFYSHIIYLLQWTLLIVLIKF